MNNSTCVWIIDDDRSIRWVLEKSLQQNNIAVKSFETADNALRQFSRSYPSAIICDIRMPGISGLEFLEKVRIDHPSIPIIIMTAHSDLDSAVKAYQGGAFEYLPKPFDIDDAVAVTQRALTHAKENIKSEPIIEPVIDTEIIGEAPAMQEVFRAIGRLSNSNITVLINGESGTGKELVAQALHRHSPRKEKPFIALNMAAIPHDLIESELFGHEKGAFTGATALRAGRFQQANSGTLFLDEIGDMPAETQTRLLRVLADGEFYRVGGHTPVNVDVRIIAATHQNLEKLVENGTFREDLFHRLNVIRVHLPKISERREDIPKLTQHFLQRAAKELDVETKILTAKTEKILSSLSWPGNVRQLENTCRWLTVMASGREIHEEDLPPEILTSTGNTSIVTGEWDKSLKLWADIALSEGKKDILNEAVPRFERALIEIALKHTAGKKRDAANLLGWGRNTLTRKLKELGMLNIAETEE